MSEPIVAYLALGSNLGDRHDHLQRAVDMLDQRDGISVVAASSMYEAAAMTRGEEQPDYLNAVVQVRTSLTAHELLEGAMEIERAEGRVRLPESLWAARTLDIDLLLYGLEELETQDLRIPHPRLHQREFVLRPLADLAPNLFVPTFDRTVSSLLADCPRELSIVRSPLALALGHSAPPQAELWPGEATVVSKSGTPRVLTRLGRLPEELRYIVIEGVIGAGKTTLAGLLAKQFDARQVFEEFEENPFLERFYADRPRWAFQTQLAFLASRFRQQQALGASDLFHEAVVSDYMFDKDRVFARMNLSGDELQLYDTMFGIMHSAVPKPDLIVYLRSSTDRLMRMIEKRGRSYERDMDRDYIDGLNQSYEQFFFQYNKTPLLVVNTEQIDFVNSEGDLEEILEQVARVRYAGTTYFNPIRR